MFLVSAVVGHGAAPREQIGRVSTQGRQDVSRAPRAWTGDGLSVVHALWRLRPEDSHDRQPLQCPAGRWVMAGDFFLHDRPGLRAALGIDPAEAAVLADSDLALRAWLRWGEGAVDRLKGWFAFAVVDRDERTITVATDRQGHRTAYVCVAEGVVTVGSTLPDMLSQPGVPRDLDVRYLSAFLTDFLFLEEETPYRAVRRVPWATVLTIDAAGGMRSRRYWRLDPTRRIRLPNDQDYVDATREMIDRAVAEAMPVDGVPASTLSAGLDSAAVVASLARQRPETRVHAFTMAPEIGIDPLGDRPIDEADTASRHAACWGNVAHEVLRFPARSEALWENPEAWFATAGVPRRNLDTHAWYEELFQRVRQMGGHAVLNGVGGNFGFSFDGIRALTTWMRDGRILKAFSEAAAIRTESTPFWPGFARGVWRNMLAPFAPDWLRRAVDWSRGRRHWPPMLRNSLLRPRVLAEQGLVEELIAEGFSQFWEYPTDSRAYMDVGFRTLRYAGADQRAAHRRRYGVEQRAPLMCPELLQFCMAIPFEQYISRGRTRWLARRVLSGALPDTSFANQPYYRQGGDRFIVLRANRDYYVSAADEAAKSPLARELLDLPRLRRVLENWPDDDDPTGLGRDPAYGRALSNAVHVGKFIRWVEGGNQ